MRRAATAAIVLTTGLMFTSCSSDEGSDSQASDPVASSSSAVPSSTPSSTPSAEAPPSEDSSADTEGGSDDVAPETLPGLALTAADFPAPYTFTKLPPEALASGTEAVGGALAGATYMPAECGNAAQATQGADLTQAGVALGVDKASGNSVVSVLSPVVEQSVDIDELAKTCASFSFSLNGPGGVPLKGDATLEALPTPDVDADEVRAFKTSVTVSVSGQKQVIDTVLYNATLRGVSVLSSATSASGADVDLSVLEDVLVAGLDKVRSAP